MNDPWVVAAIAVAGLVAGVLVALAGQRYIFGLSRERRAVGYDILTAGVIIPKRTEPNPAAAIVVRRSALEGRAWAPGEPDEPVPVEEVYGFRIRLRNCGNVVLHNQAVRLSFDESAKVILTNLESAPEMGDERVEIAVVEEGRSVVMTFPYLNPKATAVVSVQTVYNTGSSCHVVAAGPGLYSFDMVLRHLIILVAAFAVAAAALAITGGVLTAIGATATPNSRTAGLNDPGVTLLVVSALPAVMALLAGVAVYQQGKAGKRDR